MEKAAMPRSWCFDGATLKNGMVIVTCHNVDRSNRYVFFVACAFLRLLSFEISPMAYLPPNWKHILGAALLHAIGAFLVGPQVERHAYTLTKVKL